MADYLLVLGDRQALGWVVDTQRMAFARYQGDVSRLDTGDRLLLYTTRGCFRNPGVDRGRLIGTAIVTSKPSLLDDPPKFGDREYPYGINLNIQTLTPFRTGPTLTERIGQIASLRYGQRGWETALRRSLVPLAPAEYRRLRASLKPHERPRADVAQGYLRWWSGAQNQPPIHEDPHG